MSKAYKQTPETVEKILQFLRAGNTRKTASIASGISEDTFARWLKETDFADQVKQAEEMATARNVGLIMQAAAKDWRAALAWLERRRPADWKERKDIGLHQGDGPPVVMVSPESLPDDVLQKLVSEFLKSD